MTFNINFNKIFVGLLREASLFDTPSGCKTKFVKYHLCIIPCVVIGWYTYKEY